ncbi:OsmC family protein [Piscinibacter sakaiensis]|uniref:OsmC family protein n=1 Tax=Piscinibacter sakaiensis TaxID=1547922 RepID=A0A0K8NWH4_PISS1|nr:OsmC family protein [Piscinibacter sakaiensis]GAP34726.1 OsmC family protein [Piscinibacter sakaiensis]
MSDEPVRVTLQQQQDYRFEVAFGAPVPPLVADEPPPLGGSAGPSPVQLLAAAVGNCLADSLLFALRKFHQAPEPIRAEVAAHVGRNAEGRLRVLRIEAALHLGVAADTLQHLDRVLQGFEAYCTVTQSVGAGIPVTVQVHDASGRALR